MLHLSDHKIWAHIRLIAKWEQQNAIQAKKLAQKPDIDGGRKCNFLSKH